MEFSDKRISHYYFQSYVSFTNFEKKILIEDAKQEVAREYKNNAEGDAFKNNIATFKDFQNVYKEIKTQEFYLKHIDEITKYAYSSVSSYVGEHMLENGLAICSDIDISIIGNLLDDKSVVFATSFCAINNDYQLRVPKIMVPRYRVTNEDVGMILTEMLITENEYTLVPSSVVTSFSEITIDFENVNIKINNQAFDVDRFCNKYAINNQDIYGKGIGTYRIIDKNEDECTITIKSIMEKKVSDITDEVVSKIKILECTTVKDAVQKIKDIYSFTFSINFGVGKVLEAFFLVNDFHFDKYVINHFKDTNYQTDEEAMNSLTIDEKKDISIKFITSIIFAQHLIDMTNYMDDLYREYDLLCITTGQEIVGTFDDFFENRSLMYVLYDYCIEKRLIERSKRWDH